MTGKTRQGMALFVVMGLLVIFIPVLMFLSQMGGAQVKRAVKFHETLQSESAALSGNNSGFCRLRGNLTGYQQFKDLIVGDHKCDVTLRPTGRGVFLQNLYYAFSRSVVGTHHFTLMTDAEQFPADPAPPVMVIPHDCWSSVGNYDINLLADQTSLENFRGEDLLRLEETKKFEQSKKTAEYQDAMNEKANAGLPQQLESDWGAITGIMATEKLL